MFSIQATLIYVERDNKILMLHRVKKENDIHEGKWNGLGGKMELGESPEECAKREMYEESGLRAIELDFAGHIFFPDFAKGNDWSVFIFHCCKFKGDLSESDEGDLHWIDKEKILDLNLWEGDRLFIPKVLSGEHFLAKFVYEDGKVTFYNIKDI